MIWRMARIKPKAMFCLILCLILTPAGFTLNAASAATPCFQEYPDSAWQQGQPPEVIKSLNSDLMLNNFQVKTPAKYDLGGVLPIYRPDYLEIFGNKTISSFQNTLVNITYPDIDYSEFRLASLTNPDAFFERVFRDVRVGAPDTRALPLSVQYTYIGKTCSDRIVKINRNMNITSIETRELQDMNDSQLQEFLGRYQNYSNIIEWRKDMDLLRMMGIWMGQTKSKPLKVILPKNYKVPKKYEYQLPNPYTSALYSSQGFLQVINREYSGSFTYFDSTDGCLTTSQGERNVHLFYSKSYFAGKKTICPIYLHVFFPGFYSENYGLGTRNDWPWYEPPESQIVIKGWVTAANTKNVASLIYRTPYYCFNGKLFLVSKISTCPAGYSRV